MLGSSRVRRKNWNIIRIARRTGDRVGALGKRHTARYAKWRYVKVAATSKRPWMQRYMGMQQQAGRSGRLGATRLGVTRLGATRLGATRLGATRLGATRLGATRLGATRLGMTLAAVLALSIPLAGCFSETYQKGYIVPEGALEQIPIGASQEQVLIL